MSTTKNIVDLATDNGFETLVNLIKEGSLTKLPKTLDLGALIEKQAYQDDSLFADTRNKRFSIATPVETYISARYAEKCATELDPDIMETIGDACDLFSVARPNPIMQNCSVTDLSKIFPSGGHIEPQEGGTKVDELTGASKVASSSERKYGTELELCLAARAAIYPDEVDNLDKIASMKSELPPEKMASLLQEFDEAIGADLPWIQVKIGTPEHAVFTKRASYVDVFLDGKSFPIEDLAEKTAAFESMGINLDFDDDPYTIKLALERLPNKVKAVLAKILC